MNFSGKVAIITGGARGIGRAYASALLNIGMKICICDIKENTAKDFLDSLPPTQRKNAFFQKCDVTSSTDFNEAFEKTISVFGRIDMLINNAGKLDEWNWKAVIEVNFVGVVQGTKLALEYMDKRKGGHGGHVINIASDAGLDPLPLGPVYCGSKHAVVGISKSYGQDYHFQRTGVTVNAICPGSVDTDMFRNFQDSTLDKSESKKFVEAQRPVKPEDIAKGLIRLLEDGKNGALQKVDSDGTIYI